MIKLLILAQLSFGGGLANHGPWATEVTHRVRTLSTPGSLTLSVVYRYQPVTIAMSITPTTFTVSDCGGQCDTTIGRIARDVRPTEGGATIVGEWDAVIMTPRVGAHFKVGTAVLSGGFALPLLQTAYSFTGPSPMATPAWWAELELGALYVLYTRVPPSRYRFTSLSEWSGLKQHGLPYPDGLKSDPQRVQWVEVGFRVR